MFYGNKSQNYVLLSYKYTTGKDSFFDVLIFIFFYGLFFLYPVLTALGIGHLADWLMIPLYTVSDIGGIILSLNLPHRTEFRVGLSAFFSVVLRLVCPKHY